jgi:hypothetical protein
MTVIGSIAGLGFSLPGFLRFGAAPSGLPVGSCNKCGVAIELVVRIKIKNMGGNKRVSILLCRIFHLGRTL